MHVQKSYTRAWIIRRTVGKKMEDACEIQTVFCLKICAPRVSSLDVWGIFTYFCSKIWPHVCSKTDTMASGDMDPFSIKKFAIVESKIK